MYGEGRFRMNEAETGPLQGIARSLSENDSTPSVRSKRGHKGPDSEKIRGIETMA
jgi:hypothetical protein